MELPILRCRKEGEGHAKKLYAWPWSRCRLLTGVLQISTHGAVMLHVRRGGQRPCRRRCSMQAGGGVSQGRGLGQLDKSQGAALDETGEHTFTRRDCW